MLQRIKNSNMIFNKIKHIPKKNYIFNEFNYYKTERYNIGYQMNKFLINEGKKKKMNIINFLN